MQVNFLSFQFVIHLHFCYLRYALFIAEQYQKQRVLLFKTVAFGFVHHLSLLKPLR